MDKNGNKIVIYDPLTGRADSKAPGGWLRDPFLGNVIPDSRIHPVAKKLLSFYPMPNTTTAGSDPWRNNYSFSPNIATDDFINHAVKVDQVIGSKDKMFFRCGYNLRTEARYTSPVTGVAANGQLPLQRINYTGVIDWVHTFTPKLLMNLRVSGSRYIELARTDQGFGYDATQLGFPKNLVDQLPVRMFPRIEASDYTDLARGSFSREPTNTLGFQPNVAWIKGVHAIRAGLDMRMTQYSSQSSGYGGMQLTFSRGYTQKVWNQGDALSGNSVASMLLGAVNGGTIDNNVFPIYLFPYYAPWIQDDWKVTRKLTLNLGVRWDLNGPIRERYDRENRGFFPDVVNPISEKLGFQVKGGIGFAGVNGLPRTPWDWDTNNVQARAGFAYSLGSKTVLRGGIGQYYMNPTGTGYRTGFNISSGIIQGVVPCVSQMTNDGRITMQSFSTAAGCTEPTFLIRPSYTVRTIPSRSGQIRRPSFREFDVNFAKNNRITEGLTLQLRLEMFNVTNSAMYDEREFNNDLQNSSFGQINKNVTRQNNFPRFLQLGIKLLF